MKKTVLKVLALATLAGALLPCGDMLPIPIPIPVAASTAPAAALSS